MRFGVRAMLAVGAGALAAAGAALAIVAMIANGAGGAPAATISGLETDMWSPMEVTIAPGDTVAFQNTSGGIPHGVVWKSGPEMPHCEGVPINEGRTDWKGSCTFVKEGVYEFYCYVHGMKMSGKIVVTAGGAATTTTSTSRSSTSSATGSYSTTSTTMSMQMPGMPASGGEAGTGAHAGENAVGGAFLDGLATVSSVASTVPADGDLNPYGVALVTHSQGRLHAGDILVSNFNNRANQQGRGSTIVQISPGGQVALFAQLKAGVLPGRCPGGVGLTTALSVLPGGYVVVGSLPTSNGTSATAKPGCLIVIDSAGKPVETLAGSLIQGPWDMTAVSRGKISTLLVSNALGAGAGKGEKTVDASTIVRIRLRLHGGREPKMIAEKVIADGIPRRNSPEALVVGPTGVGLGANGTLYVADTLANSITAVPHALTRNSAAPHGGRVLVAGGMLKEPLGLAIVPGGDIVTANAGDGNLVESTPEGKELVARAVDTKTGAGSLFGLLVAPDRKGVYFVDDGENALDLLH